MNTGKKKMVASPIITDHPFALLRYTLLYAAKKRKLKKEIVSFVIENCLIKLSTMPFYNHYFCLLVVHLSIKNLFSGTMDLNEFPPEFDYDFLDESIANPSYYTQAPLCDASLRGSEHNNAGNDLYNQNDNDNQNADACSLNNPEDAAAPDQLVLGVTEEVEEDI